MEQKKKITLEPVTHYDLTLEELKTMYIYIALSKYSNLRHPNYDEDVLLNSLRLGFKRFIVDAQELTKLVPNSRSLHEICAFFDYHNKNLKRIVKMLEDA